MEPEEEKRTTMSAFTYGPLSLSDVKQSVLWEENHTFNY